MADPHLTSVAISSQTPGSVLPGGSATYTVTVSRTNSGGLEIHFSVAGLPVGTTATFSPGQLKFSGGEINTLSTTMTLTTSDVTPGCTYGLTITATEGQSHNQKTCTGTLLVAGAADTQGILCTGLLPDGSFRLTCKGDSNQVCFVQATTNLFTPDWVTIGTNATDANGMFAFIDRDAATLPTRFYRTLPAN
jgi:hypothetical protein